MNWQYEIIVTEDALAIQLIEKLQVLFYKEFTKKLEKGIIRIGLGI